MPVETKSEETSHASETRRGEAGAAEVRLDRRLFLFRMISGAAAATLLATGVTVALPQPALAQRRGVTDADPSDDPGMGRGRPRARRGVTDSDPSDGAGQGRGRARRRFTGVTDNDPNDAEGYGIRARRRRSVSDNDPTDPEGRGRGW